MNNRAHGWYQNTSQKGVKKDAESIKVIQTNISIE
jgi:hypothetical protein